MSVNYNKLWTREGSRLITLQLPIFIEKRMIFYVVEVKSDRSLYFAVTKRGVSVRIHENGLG